MPKISIIIPVYNVEDYLSICLDSLINQTFKDFEVICVNDESTDSSLNILKKYSEKDSRIIILNQKHNGAASARNLGIEYIQERGNKDCFVQFLDADDYFELNMLEELYKAATKFDADLTVSSFNKITPEGEIEQNTNTIPINLMKIELEKVFNYKDCPEDIFEIFNVAVWNKLYSSKLIFENNLRFQTLTSCNDVFFGYLSRIYAQRIVIVNKSLLNYRMDRVGSISEKRVKYATNIIKAARRIKEILVEKNIYQLLKPSFIVVFKRHFRYQTSLCSYGLRKSFFEELEKNFPDEYSLFMEEFPEENVTFEYLSSFIKDKKVVLWGASLFIRSLLENEESKHPQILGIIDKNQKLIGQKVSDYTIFSPEDLIEIKPDAIILTVCLNNKKIYLELKNFLEEKYPEIELLPNIFDYN